MCLLQVEELTKEHIGKNRILVVHELLQTVAFEQMQVSPFEEQKSPKANDGGQRSRQITGAWSNFVWSNHLVESFGRTIFFESFGVPSSRVRENEN